MGNKLATKQKRRFLPLIMCSLILVATNVTVFRSHYFLNASIPWDFQLTYYWFRYYWITSMQQGIFPLWNSFQAYGYPFPLNPQTSLFYPLEWVFVLTGQIFTMHAAVVMHGVHVLIGSFGAMFLARVMKFNWIESLSIAVAYHFFGLFFSNASHVDTIKGNAILPWLIGLIVCCGSESKRPRHASYLFLPITQYAFVTGAYIGTIVSTFIILGLYFFGVTIKSAFSRNMPTRTVLIPVILLSVGTVVAMPYLLPLLMAKDEFTRSINFSANDKAFATYDHFFTFFMPYIYNLPNVNIPNDVTMRTFFITSPMFFSLYLLKIRNLKKYIALFLFCLIAVLMMTNNPIFNFVTSVFSPANLSRFPISDYRIFLSLPVALIGCRSMKEFIEFRLENPIFFLKLVCILFTVATAFYLQDWQEALATNTFKISFFASIIGFLILLFVIQFELLRNKNVIWGWILLLVFFDGYQYHFNQKMTWSTDSNEALLWSASDGSTHPRNYPDWQKKLITAISESTSQRPGRVKSFPEMNGYREGRYSNDDYAGGNVFKNSTRIKSDAFLTHFMDKPSIYLSLPGFLSEKELLKYIEKEAYDISSNITPSIKYSAQNVSYEVESDHIFWAVENEMNFKGWEAKLTDRQGRIVSTLIPVKDLPIRAWRIPSGKYRLEIVYNPPWLHASFSIAVFTLLSFTAFWVALVTGKIKFDFL